MPRSASLLLIGLSAALAVAGPFGVGPLSFPLPTTFQSLDDAFPIRRVRVTEAQLADLFKQADPEPLVRLPRSEFEARVRKAAEMVRDTRAPVRLVEARFKAALRGTDLVGTADWVLVNSNPRAVAFPVDPLRLAIRSARWADGAAAVLGVFGQGFPPGPSLWVESGRQVLALEWSAMGTPEPGERRFELRAPPCPAASLELDLPADRVPVPTGTDVLLTGPFPAPEADRRLWRFRFGGGSRLDVVVRAGGNDPTPRDPVRATLVAKYDVEPGQTTCTFEYDLEPARGAIAEWVFDVDPGVRVSDVVVNNRAGWQVEMGATPGGPTALRVQMRQPSPGGKVRIAALAPPPDAANSDIPLPGIRPRNGRVGEERVEVRVGSDLKLAGWSGGDFRLVNVVPAADRSLALSFVGSLVPSGVNQAFRRLPGVAAAGVGTAFTTREAIEWRVDAGRAVLTAAVHVRVLRGPLFKLAFPLPPGYTVTRLTAVPDDAVAFSGPQGGPPPTTSVEFRRPLAVEHEVELRFELRGPVLPAASAVRPEAPVKLPFPRFAPVGAAEREGTFTIGAVPGWRVMPQVTGVPELPASAANSPPGDGPIAYPYHGREPEGFLYLAPRRPDWNAASETLVSHADGKLIANTRLDLHIPVGSVSSLVVMMPEPNGRERSWRAVSADNALANVTAIPLGELPGLLPLLAAPNTGFGPILACGSVLDGPRTAWRLILTRPARGNLTLETSTLLPTASAVPLPTLVGCPSQFAGVVLDPGVATDFRFDAPKRDRVAQIDVREPTRLRLYPTTRTAGTPSGDWKYDALYQASRLDGPDGMTVVFGGRLILAGGETLPVTLPAGAEPLAAMVGGRWVSPRSDAVAASDEGLTLRLPIPSGGPTSFEVRYRLPAAFRCGFAQPTSPRPTLPGEPSGCLRTWLLRREIVHLWPGTAVDAADASALDATLFTGPLAGGSGTTVRRGSGWDEGHAADEIAVVRQPILAAIRSGLAALVLALGWRAATRPRRPCGRATVAAIVLLAVLGAVADLGGKPFSVPLVAGAVAIALLVIARARPLSPAFSPSPPVNDATKLAVGAAVVILAFGILPRGRADSPAVRPVTVYIVSAADGTDEAVVVPRAALDRLDALARPINPAVVVTEAHLDGRADGDMARFEARFQVHNFTGGPAEFVLPLAGARLEGVRVGNSPAFPVATKADAYTVALPGHGSNTVTATFTVPVVSSGADRELQFGIPEVPVGRVTLTAPPGARQMQLGGWHGEQTSSYEATGGRLTADLGGGRTVLARWRQGAGGGTAATIKMKEACIWEVAELGAELTACYLFHIERGTATGFRFDLPTGIDLTRVAVRSPDAPSGSTAVLRDWTFGPDRGGVRALRVQLQSPAEGRVLVILEGVPRRPLTRQPSLRFPRPTGGVEVESTAYAFRAESMAVEGFARVGLIEAPADTLARDFPGVSELQFPPASPPRVFRSANGQSPEFRPTLRAPGALPAVTQEVTWLMAPNRHAEAVGTVRWASKDGPLPAAEFDLSGVRVRELRGPDVVGWAQTPGGRVQVWFRANLKEPTIEWIGSATVGPATKPPDPLLFDPPVPRPENAGNVITTLRVRPPDGWGVRVERDRGWNVIASQSSIGREWAFRAENVPLAPRWTLYSPRPATFAHGFGLLEAHPAALVYRVVLEDRLPRARPHHLVLRVVGLPVGAAVEPTFPPGVRVTPNAATATTRDWDLDVPAGMEPVRVAVVTRLVPPTGELILPSASLEVAGGAPVPPAAVQTFGFGGSAAPSYRLSRAIPLSTDQGDAVRKTWPAEFDRLRQLNGSLWRPASPTSRFRLTPANVAAVEKAAPPGPAVTVQIPAGEPRIAMHALPEPARESLALTWCLILAAVAVLAARFPQSTWPEQLALLIGLMVVWLGGSAWYALLMLAFARAGWLVRWRYRLG